MTGPPFRSRHLFRTRTWQLQASTHNKIGHLMPTGSPPGPPLPLPTTTTVRRCHHQQPRLPIGLPYHTPLPAVSSRVCRLAHGMPINPTPPHTLCVLELPIASCCAEPVPRCTQWFETIRHRYGDMGQIRHAFQLSPSSSEGGSAIGIFYFLLVLQSHCD